jgi:RNA polymerase sigma-70 factor (ECF subfamily)
MAKRFGNTQQIESLLADIQAGDATAREKLISESQERFRRLASKMLRGFPGVARIAGQTEDVLQPVLLRLYDVLQKKKFDSGQAYVAYVASMIRHELLDLCRKYRQELKQRITNGPDSNGKIPIERIAQSASKDIEAWSQLHEAVEQLPEDEKAVIEHRCFGRWSRQETAVILAIDEKTVTRRYGKAIEKLGRSLREVSFE